MRLKQGDRHRHPAASHDRTLSREVVSVSGDRPSARRLLADLLEPTRVAVPSRAAWSAVVFRRIEVEPLRLRDCPMNGARTDRTSKSVMR
jgi:hypothetical protein